MSKLDWSTDETQLLINPRLPEAEKNRILSKKLPELKGHVWLLTSGSEESHFLKLVGLSKKALLVSAKTVNDFVNSDEKDVWIKCLPSFHVGGLSIEARCYLSGAKCVDISDKKWSAKVFVEVIEESKATLSSLVPAQVVDLICLNIKAPPSLRAIFVGGGALSRKHLDQARQLGWPLMPSYGLTECSSQVATMPLGKDQAELLPHIEGRVDKEGLLWIKSEALLSCYVKISSEGEFKDPKVEDPKFDGWFQTKDRAHLNGRYLEIFGRASEEVKRLGELVNLSKLRKKLSEISAGSTVITLPEEREGVLLRGVFENESLESAEALVNKFNEQVAPYERMSGFYLVREIPKTDIGKIHYSKLKEKLRC